MKPSLLKAVTALASGIALLCVVCVQLGAAPSHTHDWTGTDVCNHPRSSFTETGATNQTVHFTVNGQHFARLKCSACSETRDSLPKTCSHSVSVVVPGQATVEWTLDRCEVTASGSGTTSHEVGKHSGKSICYAQVKK